MHPDSATPSSSFSSFSSSVTPPADPVAAVTHADPYPFYETLRAGPALAWHPVLKLWVASRADVVEALLRAHDALRVRPVGEPVPRALVGSAAGEVFGHLVRMNDGAAHAAHKPALQRALAGIDLGAAHAAALQLARALPAEPVSDLLFAAPLQAVAQLLGFGPEALPEVVRWMRDFVACLSPLSTATQLGDASRAADALMRRFEVLVAAAAPPREASLLAAVRDEASAERTPDSRAMLANLVGLLSQTCDATAGLLGNSLVALAREDGLQDAARSREGLRAIVEETARHDPSVQNTRRFVAAPVSIAGVPLAAGDTVLLVLAAANRDPAFNPAPERFLCMRENRRMLGFGHGMHACPGQALACTLAAAALEALLARGVDPAALRARGWRYRPSANARIPLFD